MIQDNIVIDLTILDKEEKDKVKQILLKNYIELLDSMMEEGDYCTVDSYWVDFCPQSKEMISGKDFIEKHT